MRGIKINNGGLLTTIQDAGRFGFRKQGVPPSGAMDIYSFTLANWLVGNDPGEALLEITLLGPEIEFLSSVIFAVTGASLNPFLNGKKVQEWRSVKAVKGDVLEFRSPSNGTRAYLAFSGGFSIPAIMGSMSTYLPAHFGGFEGRALKKGDIIPLYPGNPFSGRERVITPEMIPSYGDKTDLRVVKGVDFGMFPDSSVSSFLYSEFTVSPDSNRMGYRLKGPRINTLAGPDVISYPVHYGSVQVPGDGMPIIMGADSQTTGGYTQIANVITADLPRLAQVKPGDIIRFRMTDYDHAIKELETLNGKIDKLTGKRHNIVCTDCMKYKY